MARLVVTAVVVEGRSRSAVARDYGVSRRWVQRLVGRYLAEGDAAFEARSRRPLSSPNKTAPELEDEIVALRKSLEEEGLDAGAATIAYHLGRRVFYASGFTSSNPERVFVTVPSRGPAHAGGMGHHPEVDRDAVSGPERRLGP